MKHAVGYAARLLAVAFILLATSVCGAAPACADETAPDSLRFQNDGTFTVLMLSDLQETQYPSPFLIRSVRGILNNYTVDLIVLLGDQLEGGSPVLRIGNDYENVKRAIDRLLEPIEEAGVPFAVLFGNHDYDAPVSVNRQMELYRARAGCLAAGGAAGEGGGYGAYALPVYGSESGDVALNFYLFDSGAYLPNGDYAAVTPGQIAWYGEHAEALRAQNGNQPVPSVALMHVAVPEVYELFDEVPEGTEGAVEGVGAARGGYYTLDSERIFTGSALEAPCPSSENHGLFDAFIAQDDVFLAVFGHDHINSFIGSVRGIDLASSPGSSYTSYGDPAVRGVRLFRFYEDHVKSYETLHVAFSDSEDVSGLNGVLYYLTTTTRIPNALKTLVLAVLLVGAMTVLLVLILKKEPPRRLPDQPEPDEDFEAPEDPYL